MGSEVDRDAAAAALDASRAMLRHTLATLAYRCGKAVRDAPEGFAAFEVGPRSRTPGAILAHVGDLLDWALALSDGRHVWHDSKALPWDQEVGRFFGALRRFDERLASPEPLGLPAERLFQGPIADALTHVGQLAMLRRLAGAPLRGENYSKAEIAAGRVGPDQAAPRREFE
jgi:hypothetical protein